MKILIIDDEEDLLETLQLRLTQSGYEVEVAADGIEGYQKTLAFKPDVILLDVMMPIEDGWTVCRRLRANPQTKDICVVMLTASRSVGPAKEVKADHILLKPFGDDELLRMLEIIRNAK